MEGHWKAEAAALSLLQRIWAFPIGIPKCTRSKCGRASFGIRPSWRWIYVWLVPSDWGIGAAKAWLGSAWLRCKGWYQSGSFLLVRLEAHVDFASSIWIWLWSTCVIVPSIASYNLFRLSLCSDGRWSGQTGTSSLEDLESWPSEAPMGRFLSTQGYSPDVVPSTQVHIRLYGWYSRTRETILWYPLCAKPPCASTRPSIKLIKK